MVVFNATNRMSAHVAAQTIISDADLDSVIQSMVVKLQSVQEGDNLFVDGCSSNASEVCHLQ